MVRALTWLRKFYKRAPDRACQRALSLARCSLPAGMPRAIWAGHLTFGLVSVPVGLYAAVEASEEVHFRLLYRKDLAPIRYKKFCSKEDVEVPGSEIVRGFEVSRGKFAVVEGEELQKVQEEVGEGDRTIELLEFVDFSSLNPLLFERPYYLVPQNGGEKPYAVLREALLETKRVGIARFYLRTRPLLAALLPGPELLALDVMRESGELRSPKGLEVPKKAVRAPEIKMARMLIEQMAGEFDPTEHPNVYRRALEKLLASKRRFEIDTRAAEEAPAKKGAKVVDLMSALKRSLGDAGKKRARGSRKRRAA
jgi:DNA end-binding protein Ku